MLSLAEMVLLLQGAECWIRALLCPLAPSLVPQPRVQLKYHTHTEKEYHVPLFWAWFCCLKVFIYKYLCEFLPDFSVLVLI